MNAKNHVKMTADSEYIGEIFGIRYVLNIYIIIRLKQKQSLGQRQSRNGIRL